MSKQSDFGTHQQVTGAGVHVLVHEVQDGEPESGEGGQGQQGGQVLQEHLGTANNVTPYRTGTIETKVGGHGRVN